MKIMSEEVFESSYVYPVRYHLPDTREPKRDVNCRNCGAPVKGIQCGYCGTSFGAVCSLWNTPIAPEYIFVDGKPQKVEVSYISYGSTPGPFQRD